MLRSITLCSVLALAGGLAFAMPAQALTMKECSVKYQAAKEANKLNGMKWNDFRKAECGDDGDASPADAAAAEPETPAATPAAAPAAPAPAAGGKVVFPTAVSPKYASETPGKARMHTCVDQYRANKTTGGNGALKWIQKGGGYYSQCNAKLKAG